MDYQGEERRKGEERRTWRLYIKRKIYDRRGKRTAEELAEFIGILLKENFERALDSVTEGRWIEDIEGHFNIKMSKEILNFLNSPREQK